MQRVVYKYPLRLRGECQIELPTGAVPRAVGAQGKVPVIWIEHDLQQDEFELLTFFVVMTGEPMTGGKYVGTFVLQWDDRVKDELAQLLIPHGFVGHVFQKTDGS
jgi:hypothetical protein